MSENAEQGVVSKSVYAVVRAIAARFKKGTEAKVEAFIGGTVVKELAKDVNNLKRDNANIKFNSTDMIEELKEDLVDAEDALKESYLNVNVARIETNADRKAYLNEYLKSVATAQAEVKAIKESISDTTEKALEDTKANEERITEIENMVDSITKG
tara:strand:+ start:284 stop:751 length:468 start_codon:yes stop_codon:yes gene_type:complete